MIVIDADGAIAGRLAAYAVKKALTGEDVVVVNAEKAVISGNPRRTWETYWKRRTMQQKSNPEKSPSQGWAKRPDKLLKRIARGMMPKHTSRAKEALKRLMIYLGVPKEFEGKAQKFRATSEKLLCTYTTLDDICRKLGWNAGKPRGK
ncbi:MAG: 50S ribosomal protein L13 [Candidatus Micrarchaeota archaeon]|nr:50S ribosomal protein L13 [Candidatus Micrarchaeota archaeon]